MIEMIHLHPYTDVYPFGLQKQTELTYVELIKQRLSPEQIQTYKHNLSIFKTLQSQMIIPMDSFLQQGNRLLIYYHYEPLSIKAYIQQKLNQFTDNEAKRDNFFKQIVNNINCTIDAVIVLLTSNHLQTLLSIDNISINPKNQIRFFIDPDFDLQNGSLKFIQEYYLTQKKKLQIQLQEFLQQIFSATGIKSCSLKKANFIIQGTKLVFINDQQSNRQSCVSKIQPFVQIIKNRQKNTTLSSQTNSQNNSKNSINSNNSNHKFDIKNILDQKKLQKSQISTTINNHKNIKKQGIEDKNDKKQVKNYFENNDDFNKDASFYPEQFIKDDSIAQFEGYEDQLEKQLEDLKKKKQEEQKRLQQKMTKFSGFSEVSTTQSKSDLPQSKSLKYPNCNQRDLNSPNNQQNDASADQKKKKIYKVTITTSHEVDVQDAQDVDLKEIQKQLVEDIKKGRLINNESSQQKSHTKNNFDKDQFLHCNSPSRIIKGRETHNPSSSHELYTNQTNLQQRNTSLNSIGSSMSSSVDQKVNDENPFSKYHHFATENDHQFHSGKEIRAEASGVENLADQGHDIQRILQKIKTNILNQQNPLTNQPQRQSIGNTNLKSKSSLTQQSTEHQSQLPSNLSVKEIQQKSQNKIQRQPQREYYEKIQKAKMRAEQIMKLVKQRKTH